jgi:hypothetical protein
MSIYKKLGAQATKFEKAYPQDLPARLEWWCTNLGIDRVRLLRMIGLSARQAARRKQDDLKEILKDPEWADNALGLEGNLVILLSLHHYDWHALAELIREASVKTPADESSRPSRRKGETKRLPSAPNGDPPDLLLYRIATGGHESLSALTSYLIGLRNGAGRVQS